MGKFGVVVSTTYYSEFTGHYQEREYSHQSTMSDVNLEWGREMKYARTKLRVLSPEHSVSFQKDVFKEGGRWSPLGEVVSYTKAKHLYIHSNGVMSYGNSEELFETDPYREITFTPPTKKTGFSVGDDVVSVHNGKKGFVYQLDESEIPCNVVFEDHTSYWYHSNGEMPYNHRTNATEGYTQIRHIDEPVKPTAEFAIGDKVYCEKQQLGGVVVGLKGQRGIHPQYSVVVEFSRRGKECRYCYTPEGRFLETDNYIALHKEDSYMENDKDTIIEQLHSELEDMRARIKILEGPSKGVWRAEHSEDYFYIDLVGNIGLTTNVFSECDNILFLMGNHFKTEEEAELSLEVKLAEQRVFKKIAEMNGEQGWTPDWNNGEQIKYSVEYNYSTNRFSTTHRRTMHCYSLGLVGSDKTIKWVMDNMESDLRTMFMLGEVQ